MPLNCAEVLDILYFIVIVKLRNLYFQNSIGEMGLNLSNARGQCYDGAAVMAGSKKGVASQIKSLNPKCLYTHCYGHALNLSVKDACTKVESLKDTFDCAKEICKLIKKSPKRETYLKKLRIQSGNKEKNVHAFCPTRWTVRGATLSSIIENHQELMELWKQSISTTSDTEMKARMIGAQTAMGKFSFLFGCLLGKKVLMQTDNLSRTLQSPELSAAEAHQVTKAVLCNLEKDRSDESFDSFWETVNTTKNDLDIDDATLPRKRRHPKHLTDYHGYVTESEQNFKTEKDMYRPKYFEVYDFVIKAIIDRFDQPDYKMYAAIQNLLFMAVRGEDTTCEIDRQVFADTSFRVLYQDDVEMPLLNIQLRLLPTLLSLDESNVNLPSILEKVRLLTKPQRLIIGEVIKLVKLILLAPATNAESERIFSGLKRVKTYLRSTMCKKRLNSLMLIHVHKELIDGIDLIDLANSFVSRKGSRVVTFGTFTIHDLPKCSNNTRSVGTQT